jgi:hypothetical protein
MGFKVQFTMTKPAVDTDVSTMMNAVEDPLAITSLLSKYEGTQEIVKEGAVKSIIYGFPTQTNWQAFYNEALPIWNNAGLMSKAANLGITYDVKVVENN